MTRLKQNIHEQPLSAEFIFSTFVGFSATMVVQLQLTLRGIVGVVAHMGILSLTAASSFGWKLGDTLDPEP